MGENRAGDKVCRYCGASLQPSYPGQDMEEGNGKRKRGSKRKRNLSNSQRREHREEKRSERKQERERQVEKRFEGEQKFEGQTERQKETNIHEVQTIFGKVYRVQPSASEEKNTGKSHNHKFTWLFWLIFFVVMIVDFDIGVRLLLLVFIVVAVILAIFSMKKRGGGIR